jgi:hypothetical protein
MIGTDHAHACVARVRVARKHDGAARHVDALRKRGREVVVCGDWNIAHREIDLKNWKSNQKNSGFLPEERAWLTRVFDEVGWVDVYRRLHPDPLARATPGGPIGDRPGRKMSGGASITTSPRRGSQPRP